MAEAGLSVVNLCRAGQREAELTRLARREPQLPRSVVYKDQEQVSGKVPGPVQVNDGRGSGR